MNANLLVRSKFMVSREFGTGDIPKEPLVTIAGVKKPDEEEALTRDWWLLSFVEPWAKPLKIITTHQQALILMFGDDTDKWIGKRVGFRAVVGVYFKKRQTAVRIVGSPDITEPRSFSVRSWGGGKDTYNLVPMGNGAPAAAPAPAHNANGKIEWLTFGTGSKAHKKIADLTAPELDDNISLGKKKLADVPAGSMPKWAPGVAAQVAAMEAEHARRAQGPSAAAPAPDDEAAPF